jgi:hypothetical protein
MSSLPQSSLISTVCSPAALPAPLMFPNGFPGCHVRIREMFDDTRLYVQNGEVWIGYKQYYDHDGAVLKNLQLFAPMQFSISSRHPR